MISFLRPAAASSHAHQRYRRAAYSAIATVAGRGVSMAAGLITVPLTIAYLGPERYGIWMTISSRVSFITFADFGIGNGLVNALSRAHGKNDHKKAREYVSSAFYSLSAIALLFGALFAGVYPVIPWERVLNIKSAAAGAESGLAVAIFVACTLLGIVVGIVQKIYVGYQEGYINQVWMIGGNLAGLLLLVLCIYLRLGLPYLVLVFAGAPLLAMLLNGFVLFGWSKKDLLPVPHEMNRTAMQELMKRGLYFFIIQACYVIGFTTDNMVIAQTVGPEAVAEYAVPYKLYSILPTVLTMIIAPLWPAYGEAVARGDYQWIRNTLNKTMKMTFGLMIPCIVVLTLLGSDIVSLWVRGAVRPSFLIMTGIAVQTMAVSVATPLAIFLNGADALKLQVGLGITQAVLAFCFKIVLARLFGTAGVPWATGLTHIIFWIIPITFLIPRFLRGIERKSLSARS